MREELDAIPRDVHDGIRHLEIGGITPVADQYVHDGIRHLETLEDYETLCNLVHDGIRHLEIHGA